MPTLAFKSNHFPTRTGHFKKWRAVGQDVVKTARNMAMFMQY